MQRTIYRGSDIVKKIKDNEIILDLSNHKPADFLESEEIILSTIKERINLKEGPLSKPGITDIYLLNCISSELSNNYFELILKILKEFKSLETLAIDFNILLHLSPQFMHRLQELKHLTALKHLILDVPNYVQIEKISHATAYLRELTTILISMPLDKINLRSVMIEDFAFSENNQNKSKNDYVHAKIDLMHTLISHPTIREIDLSNSEILLHPLENPNNPLTIGKNLKKLWMLNSTFLQANDCRRQKFNRLYVDGSVTMPNESAYSTSHRPHLAHHCFRLLSKLNCLIMLDSHRLKLHCKSLAKNAGVDTLTYESSLDDIVNLFSKMPHKDCLDILTTVFDYRDHFILNQFIKILEQWVAELKQEIKTPTPHSVLNLAFDPSHIYKFLEKFYVSTDQVRCPRLDKLCLDLFHIKEELEDAFICLDLIPSNSPYYAEGRGFYFEIAYMQQRNSGSDHYQALTATFRILLDKNNNLLPMSADIQRLFDAALLKAFNKADPICGELTSNIRIFLLNKLIISTVELRKTPSSEFGFFGRQETTPNDQRPIQVLRKQQYFRKAITLVANQIKMAQHIFNQLHVIPAEKAEDFPDYDDQEIETLETAKENLDKLATLLQPISNNSQKESQQLINSIRGKIQAYLDNLCGNENYQMRFEANKIIQQNIRQLKTDILTTLEEQKTALYTEHDALYVPALAATNEASPSHSLTP